MNLAFRELDNNDLADIKELSDSMGLLNSPKIGETASAYIHNSECLIYGAFLDDKLVGVGCLTEKTEKFAWIESIRVHGEYQKRGIGTALFNFGEELARSRNFEKIGFQTVTENKGSCRIGELNRFQRGHEMVTFYLKHEHFPNLSEKYKTPTHIDAAEAILFLNKISNGKMEEICIGWNYAPLEKEYFESNPDMNFYIVSDSLLFEYLEKDSYTNKVAFIKGILYGSSKNIRDLLLDFIKRNAKWNKTLFCLCPEELSPNVLELNFKYGKVWNGGKNIVVAFTKKLH
ncbi:MAG: GNAT family N-acetyltransferase [Candidatus Heimdallarchaeota archaeon]